MSERALISINARAGEVRIEGSEDFVTAQIARLENLLALAGKSAQAGSKTKNPGLAEDGDTVQSDESIDATNGTLFVPEHFGEWFQSFNDGTSDQEKALIAAYFVQNKSEANEFKTSEVTKLLTDHGIKLSNGSATLKQIEQKKLIFQTRKPSKISYKRVSQDGIQHLKMLRR